jgi:hypothetical protein
MAGVFSHTLLFSHYSPKAPYLQRFAMVSHVNFRHCSHHNGSLTVTGYNRMLDKFCDGQTETYVCLPNLELALGFRLVSSGLLPSLFRS